MIEPRRVGKKEALDRGIREGWYPVDNLGNLLTDEPFPSEEAVEKWIRENYPEQSPEVPRPRGPLPGPSM